MIDDVTYIYENVNGNKENFLKYEEGIHAKGKYIRSKLL